MSEGEMVVRTRDRGSDSERGQGLLEFALVVAFLLITMFGIIDFARVFFGYATMSNGVREGARYAIVNPDDLAGIEDAARGMMLVIGAPVVVGVSFPDTCEDGVTLNCTERGSAVVVTATSDFAVWTPLIPNFTMEASATMHIE
jgi:Flp pilus assembly protein TadG